MPLLRFGDPDPHTAGSDAETSMTSEWFKVSGRPCSARETVETCSSTAPVKGVMEHPPAVLWTLEFET